MAAHHFTGRTVLITGASSGVGAAAARAFADAGAHVVMADELRASGIHVSVVSPGPIASDFILADVDSVSDITFSQPMSTPEQIAELILACAADGRVERTRPAVSGIMASLGYVFPALPRTLRPLLAAKGRRAKAKYRGH